ncbi:DEAD/DEAH box helicase [Priestia flexa]|uniref:DEAD/DEAH box helicase n=1 Tax=Priestia flexa TaxID=86664 RepID=UPI00077C5D29|nr:DEAD/DEAH box helicase [Priestia flexa]MED4588238.1 DEAD/DEAH box helicase [Priestia flexa]
MAEHDEVRDLYKELKQQIHKSILPPSVAKLYSQFTRLNMKQPGLKGWENEEEFSHRLNDAVTLVDAGLFEKDFNGEEWRDLLKRAGEILEWLSHPELNTNQLPLKLLAASAYQLAGFPALAMGLLKTRSVERNESLLLGALLKADFQGLIELIVKYWESEKEGITQEDDYSLSIQHWIINETVKTLGIIASYMRWGEEDRVEKAKKKFLAITDVIIDGKDPYSWLLAKLCSEVILEFSETSLRRHVGELSLGIPISGQRAFQRYLRNNYLEGKTLAWNSQIKGIERLKQDESFALCTPTGSGKTTIAELAIIKSLFISEEKKDEFSSALNIRSNAAPIVMYLVPSRALATEVENKLSKVLQNLSDSSIIVSGLYGGIDWGPTDAWITSDKPTVLICTYEKGEALLRFLGPLFLSRVELVVIDEAHSVQFDGNYDTLITSDNRGLRLEMLANRLIYNMENKKVIALSAVADGGIQALSNWISGELETQPEVTQYKSTRQLIGRLEWQPTGNFEFRYDILNGCHLKFAEDGGKNDVPYIKNPFDAFPKTFSDLKKKYTNQKVGKRQRPYLFWAAIQMVKPDKQGLQHTVLISITQHISGYAEDFVDFFENIMNDVELPQFFTPPQEQKKAILWEKCLRSCEDYFGVDSFEYKLLKRGIVVHHGSMPGLMSRLLIEVINERIVKLALATSTLSEGVNLPFETVIIPTIIRSGKPIGLSEFKNLIGRAGRPGVGTEGKSLVMLEKLGGDYSAQNARNNYNGIINEITKQNEISNAEESESPLAELIRYLVKKWAELTGSNSVEEFYKWIEEVSPLNMDSSDIEKEEVVMSLDSLDSILLPSIVEFEQMEFEEGDIVNRLKIEEHLKSLWEKTYAYYTNSDIGVMKEVFSIRGGTIFENIYPDKDLRRRFYRTSLSPVNASQLLQEYMEINEHLKVGADYAKWTKEEKISYISKAIEVITSLNKFKIQDGVGKVKSTDILHWWLSPSTASKKPNSKQKSKWIKYIKRNFEYIFNWGLGSVISLSLDDAHGSELKETKIEEWPETGLPWIVFWLKELIVWGTLDPVAAYLLAHGIDSTRSDAEERASEYYENNSDFESTDDILNASKIRAWGEVHSHNKKNNHLGLKTKINAALSADFKGTKVKKWRVLPVLSKMNIIWIDPAGYELATSLIPEGWSENYIKKYDFVLDTREAVIIISPYI